MGKKRKEINLNNSFRKKQPEGNLIGLFLLRRGCTFEEEGAAVG